MLGSGLNVLWHVKARKITSPVGAGGVLRTQAYLATAAIDSHRESFFG